MRHMSHDIVEVPPRHTSHLQTPVDADHENNVHFNPGRSAAIIRAHRRRSPHGIALAVRYVPEGGNSLLDPPTVILSALGGGPEVTVTVESLLYAIKQMQDDELLARQVEIAEVN